MPYQTDPLPMPPADKEAIRRVLAIAGDRKIEGATEAMSAFMSACEQGSDRAIPLPRSEQHDVHHVLSRAAEAGIGGADDARILIERAMIAQAYADIAAGRFIVVSPSGGAAIGEFLYLDDEETG